MVPWVPRSVTISYNGLYRDYRVFWGNIGIMEKKMETTIKGLGFGGLGYMVLLK